MDGIVDEASRFGVHFSRRLRGGIKKGFNIPAFPRNVRHGILAMVQQFPKVIQVWRAIRAPIMRDPLAMCDAQSMSPKDFIAAERRFPNRVGEIYHIAWNPQQRWYYYPQMTREEAIVFKCYDSQKDVARFTAHGAFADPGSAVDAPPRESMEARILAIFAP